MASDDNISQCKDTQRESKDKSLERTRPTDLAEANETKLEEGKETDLAQGEEKHLAKRGHPVKTQAQTTIERPVQAPLVTQSHQTKTQGAHLLSRTEGGQLERQPDNQSPSTESFRPSRRVREPIGGGSAQISDLFSGDADEFAREAARESARRRGLLQESKVQPQVHTESSNPTKSVEKEVKKAENVFRPTRRVRYVSYQSPRSCN